MTTDSSLDNLGYTAIPFSRTDTPDQIADSIASVLAAAPGLGLAGAQSVGGGTVAVGGAVGDDLMLLYTGLRLEGTPGVSPGTFAVPFLPTAQFSATATAASLQNAIRDAGIAVQTFSLGGGRLLVSGAQSVSGAFGGDLPANIGTTLLAVSDLAGNPVRETRINDETRFTIIMPLVEFDFGDAPNSYGTLEIDNGARHTISDDRLPRLGAYLDTEINGQPDPLSDDQPIPVSATETGVVFSVASPVPNVTTITVNPVNPSGGEKLTLNVDGTPTTFELILATDNPTVGNVPVIFVNGETPESIAAKIVTAIRGSIRQIDEAVLLSVDASGSVITLEAIDDEDGVSIGTFIANSLPYQVFTVPGTDPNNVTGDDVLGFLNPLDPAGSTMAVTVQGAGLLEAWVDFNLNGSFEREEQVLTNTPVIDGVNLVTVFSPADAPLSNTWMRVRVSGAGNLLPTGVSVGGEVEDYRISVLPIPLPTPVDDPGYTVPEDTTLVADSLNPPLLLDNDLGLGTQILPVRFFVGTGPQNGMLTVTDELSGEFNYEPDPDFYGIDTFTYRLSTQQNAGLGVVSQSTFATVTINVTPVNDNPDAQDQLLSGLEDNVLVIDAADLLVGATAHLNAALLSPPIDESIQQLHVTSVTAGGVRISAANPGSVATTAEGGTLTAQFDANGFLTSAIYTPDTDFNSDNLPLSSGGFLLDDFEFEIQDDGILELADGTTIQGTPLTDTATVSLRITPQNDVPLPVTEVVSIAEPSYQDYFTTVLGEPVRVPTEDTQIVIPGGFLLVNDLSGRLTAQDEVQFIRNNDGPVRIVDVGLVDPADGQIVLLPNGDVEYTPADDIYGNVLFTYTVEDVGVDEAIDGTRVINPLQSTVTSTVFLEPVNDAPIAYDRFLELDEVAEPSAPAVLTFTANDLIAGSGINPLSPISVTPTSITVPDGATMIDGETLRITDADGLVRIVEFSTSAIPSAGTDTLVTYAVGDPASSIATGLQDALRTAGAGGTAVGDTVSFLNVTSITSNPIASTIVADALGVTLLDGSTIIGGETVTIADGNAGITIFEFSKSGLSLSGGDVLVPITDTDDAMTVANNFQAALVNNGFGGLASAGVGPEWNVRFTVLRLLSIENPGSQIVSAAGDSLSLPDGIDLIDGETVRVDDGSGFSRTIEFNTSGVASPGTDVVVQYDATQLADTVAANLVAALRLQNYGATAVGGDVTFTSVTSAVAAPPVTSIVSSSQSMVLPDGSALIDGETLTVDAAGNTIVVEFNTGGLPSPGTDIVVPFTALDTAAAIATRVEGIFRRRRYCGDRPWQHRRLLAGDEHPSRRDSQRGRALRGESGVSVQRDRANASSGRVPNVAGSRGR